MILRYEADFYAHFVIDLIAQNLQDSYFNYMLQLILCYFIILFFKTLCFLTKSIIYFLIKISLSPRFQNIMNFNPIYLPIRNDYFANNILLFSSRVATSFIYFEHSQILSLFFTGADYILWLGLPKLQNYIINLRQNMLQTLLNQS